MTDAEVMKQVEDAIDAFEQDMQNILDSARRASSKVVRGRSSVTLAAFREWDVAGGVIDLRIRWVPDD